MIFSSARSLRDAHARCFRKKHMAWFGNWFSKQGAAAGGLAADSEFFDPAQAVKSATAGSLNASARKSARMEQRELLYTVVRETMVRVGLITSGYKYKVLSLDPQGRQYLIMMDIKPDLHSQSAMLSKIEHLLTQEALARHDIQITGVYWRCTEHKVLDEPKLPAPDARVKPTAVAAATSAPVPAVTPLKPTPVEPTDAKKALEKAFSRPRVQRSEAAASAFPDTLLLDHEEREFPLSATQLGTWN